MREGAQPSNTWTWTSDLLNHESKFMSLKAIQLVVNSHSCSRELRQSASRVSRSEFQSLIRYDLGEIGKPLPSPEWAIRLAIHSQLFVDRELMWELMYVHSRTMKSVCLSSGREPSEGISFATQKLLLVFKCQLSFCFHQVRTFSNTLTKPYFSTMDRALKPPEWLIALTGHTEHVDLVLSYIPILFHGT